MIALAVALVIGAAPPARYSPEEGQRRRAMGAMFQRAHADWNAGRRAEALAGMARADGIAVSVHGRDSFPALATTQWLTLWSGRVGKWDDAASGRERLWRIKAALLGEGHPDAIDARWAAEMVKRVAALTTEERAAFGRAEAVALAPLSTDPAAALPKYEEAARVCEAVLGKAHPLRAKLLDAVGQMRHDLGQYAAALAMHREALAVREATLGKAHPLRAESLSNLAVLLAETGDNRAAVPLSREAYLVTHAARGARHRDTVTTLGNYAAMLARIDEKPRALRLLRQVVTMVERTEGGASVEYAQALSNLAGVLGDKGDEKEALAMYRRALDVVQGAGGERHPLYPAFLSNLATAQHHLGDRAEARALLEKAVTVVGRTHGERHPWYARVLHSLAVVRRGDDEAEARRLADRALALIGDALRADAAGQSDRQQMDAARSLRHALDLRLTLPGAGGYAHLIDWKGAGLMRQRQRRLSARLAADPKTREAAARLAEATRGLAALARSPSPPRAAFERLTARQEEAQAELSRLSGDAKRAGERVSPEAVARALPDGAVLVDYLFHHDYARKANRLVAFVSRKGAEATRVDLGAAADVEKAAAAWRSALLRGDMAGGAALKQLIWSPLEKHLGPAKVVLVSPDGVLGTVPFAALPGAKEGSYLIEEVAVAVVPAAQALPTLAAPAKAGEPSLLVVGGLEYGEGWAKLPATAAEADDVRRLFKGAVTDLRRREAGREAVRAGLGKVSFAHLATHGYFAPEAMRADGGPGLFGREGAGGWHPLLLSGLVLSDGDGGGVLTALEVSETDLSGMELVVLSACETGLGKVAGGEGLLGMQRAFQIAGARASVASLWKVADEATRVLMGRFYANLWGKKMGRLEALAEAQRWMLREGHSVPGVTRGAVAELAPAKGTRRLPPYYWAAFVLSGDWR